MEDPRGMRARGSVDFVEASVLDTIIPEATELNIEEVLAGSVEKLDDEQHSPFAAIPRRTALFFDETINVYIVLQTPYIDETVLRSDLSRLDITLEAQAVNAQAESTDGKPNFEIIYSGSVSDLEDPLIIVQAAEGDGDDAQGHVLIVWKAALTLAKPQRLRMQSPSIVFAAAANYKTGDAGLTDAKKDEYLPSLMPSALNLLESFNEDRVIGPSNPRLSALRVSRVAPAQMGKHARPLKNISRRAVRIYPALGTRVRFMRPSNNSPGNLAILVSLDLEVSPYTNCPMTLEKVTMELPGGLVQDLNQFQGLKLPVDCQPLDDITFIYRASPSELDIPRSNTKLLDITVHARAKISETSRPEIVMNWKSVIDFTVPVNPGYGPPSQAIQRRHRPSQLSLGSTLDMPAIMGGPPEPPPHDDVRRERVNPNPDFGVTMTFRSVTDKIVAGQVFTWEVFVVNRSDRSRKLAIVVVPRRRRTESRISRPPSSGYGRKDIAVADAVVDENVLHAMQRSSAMEPAELVCLSSDVRIGPLSPSACHTVELKFMAMHPGTMQLDAVRIIDMGSNEHVDVRDLPTIHVTVE